MKKPLYVGGALVTQQPAEKVKRVFLSRVQMLSILFPEKKASLDISHLLKKKSLSN